MTSRLLRVLRSASAQLLQRPKRRQVAALCTRGTGDDQQVLLVTSRGTGRWIIPKGWPIRGLASSQAALQEAWEEAGVQGATSSSDPIGSYDYDKTMDDGPSIPIETLVYPVTVDRLEADFPEAGQRERRWVTPQQAAHLVNEPSLKMILKKMTVRPKPKSDG